jgi:hypothetical protein
MVQVYKTQVAQKTKVQVQKMTWTKVAVQNAEEWRRRGMMQVQREAEGTGVHTPRHSKRQ